MEVTTENILKEIEEVLQKNKDAKKGFAKAADIVKDTSLRNYFQRKALSRKNFNDDLAREIKIAYPDLDIESSFKGSVHRAWMDIKSFFSANTDEAMLNEAVRGDQAAIDEYDDILDYPDLPIGLRSILLSQRAEIQKDIEESKMFEEVYS